jgi:hypothetical protein
MTTAAEPAVRAVHAQFTPVPVPAALPLMASAVGALAGMRRRRTAPEA